MSVTYGSIFINLLLFPPSLSKKKKKKNKTKEKRGKRENIYINGANCKKKKKGYISTMNEKKTKWT
jgi:hypothetical protein